MRVAEERRFTTHDGTELFYRDWPAQGGACDRAVVLFHRGDRHPGEHPLSAARWSIGPRAQMALCFFRALRSQRPPRASTLDTFEVALGRLGSLSPEKAVRSIEGRVDGVRRLVRAQAGALLAPAGLISALPWLR